MTTSQSRQNRFGPVIGRRVSRQFHAPELAGGLHSQIPSLEPPEAARVRALRTVLSDRRIRYIAVGSIAAVVYYACFSAGYLLLGHRMSISPGLAADVVALLANLATALLTYPLYRVVVFSGEGPWLSGFLRFYVIAFWSVLWSLVGLPLLIDVAGVPPLLAQAIIVVAVPLINYQIHMLWTFRRRMVP